MFILDHEPTKEGTRWSIDEPLRVHNPALSAQQPAGHAAAPADVICPNLVETIHERGLLQACEVTLVALGASELAHNPAGQAFGEPVVLLHHKEARESAIGATESPSARSLKIAFSNSASAKNL